MSILPGVSIAAAVTQGALQPILMKQRSIGVMIADVTVSESHDDELVITEHPVEQGAVISDHAFKRPARVTLQIGYSNSSPQASSINSILGNKLPIPISGAQLGTVASAIAGPKFFSSGFGSVALKAGGLLGSFGAFGAVGSALGLNQYVYRMYNAFVELQASRVLISVITGKRKYNNMLIKRLSTTTDHRTENALMLTVDLQEVIVTTTPQPVSVPQAVQKTPEKTAATQFGGVQHLATPFNPDTSLTPNGVVASRFGNWSGGSPQIAGAQ